MSKSEVLIEETDTMSLVHKAFKFCKDVYMLMCVFLVTWMLYLSMKYTGILVVSAGLLLFKIVLVAAVFLFVLGVFMYKRRGHTAAHSIKFVWGEEK